MQFNEANDPKIAALLMNLFAPGELRQFIQDWVGSSIARQLPGEIVSMDSLARGAVAVLRRNNLLDQQLFDELRHARPHQQSHLTEVAEQCSPGPLAVTTSAPLAPPSRRTPDYVIQQTYESLVTQRDLVRALVHNFTPSNFIISVDSDGDEPGFVSATRQWLDTHSRQIAYPPVRQALNALGLAFAGMSARDEGIRLFTAAIATFVAADAIKAHLQTLHNFAQMTEVQLFDLVIQQVGLEPRALT